MNYRKNKPMLGNNKLFSIILFSLLGISALLSILFFVGAISADLLLGWCYTLLGAAALVSIVFPIAIMAKNPKKAKTALFGVIGLLVIFGIGYAMAGSETYQLGEVTIDAGASRRSEAGIIAFYILIIGAIGAIIYSEVAKAFK
jgi:membrane protease YdiL (CAAX protease family)